MCGCVVNAHIYTEVPFNRHFIFHGSEIQTTLTLYTGPDGAGMIARFHPLPCTTIHPLDYSNYCNYCIVFHLGVEGEGLARHPLVLVNGAIGEGLEAGPGASHIRHAAQGSGAQTHDGIMKHVMFLRVVQQWAPCMSVWPVMHLLCMTYAFWRYVRLCLDTIC